MRTYLILKEKAQKFNQDAEIQGLIRELNADPEGLAPLLGSYSKANADRIGALNLDRVALGKRGYSYEKLDQLTTELLLGLR